MNEVVPGITAKDILKLKFNCSTEQKPPLIWLLTDSLRSLWCAKKEKLVISVEEIRTSVEANLTLLRETKHKNLAEGIGSLMDLFFI